MIHAHVKLLITHLALAKKFFCMVIVVTNLGGALYFLIEKPKQ